MPEDNCDVEEVTGQMVTDVKIAFPISYNVSTIVAVYVRTMKGMYFISEIAQ